ncbi:hypothetical protein MLD38_001827 [Melastoma candidum]|uniref:Uncharacterized protein n=1 Tax=Melastoma candidum TaxID=119954 RepID=A0ACB9SGG6_9MYRT|nr:hypothetical protein MLD38_001827 [Melastoma candidum]
MKPIVVLLMWSICTSLSGPGKTTALIELPPNETVPGVIAFGDSIVDTGNNNALNTLIKCNFLPYGKDFDGGKPTGRFCDGKVPIDILGKEMGIKDSVPAYLDPNVTIQDLVTGVSFASGGSGFDPLTPKLVSVISLTDQLEHFKEYIGKLRAAIGDEQTNFTLGKSMFLLVAGSDDIANTYFTSGVRKFQYDMFSYTDMMAKSASKFLQDLYEFGARRIAVFGAPPIGCVPSQRTLSGGALRACADDLNRVAQLFNTKLSSRIDSLNGQFPNSKMVYIDVYSPLLDLIQRPQSYGFQVSDKGCCGTGSIEVAVLCNQETSTCSNASGYVFWDSFHPTERAYETLVIPLINKYLGKFF